MLKNTKVPASNIVLFLLMAVYLRTLISVISLVLEIDVYGLVLWRGDEAVVEEKGVQLGGR